MNNGSLIGKKLNPTFDFIPKMSGNTKGINVKLLLFELRKILANRQQEYFSTFSKRNWTTAPFIHILILERIQRKLLKFVTFKKNCFYSHIGLPPEELFCRLLSVLRNIAEYI